MDGDEEHGNSSGIERGSGVNAPQTPPQTPPPTLPTPPPTQTPSPPHMPSPTPPPLARNNTMRITSSVKDAETAKMALATAAKALREAYRTSEIARLLKDNIHQAILGALPDEETADDEQKQVIHRKARKYYTDLFDYAFGVRWGVRCRFNKTCRKPRRLSTLQGSWRWQNATMYCHYTRSWHC